VQELLQQGEDDALIIVVDDDQLYDPHTVEQYVTWAKRMGNDVALAMRGHKITIDENISTMHVKSVYHSYEVDQPECLATMSAVGTYAVRPKFFADERLWKELPKYPSAKYVDDIWVSGNVARQKIKRYIIPGRTKVEGCSKEYCTPTDFQKGLVIQPWKIVKVQETTPQLRGGDSWNANHIISLFIDYWDCKGDTSSVFNCYNGTQRLHPYANCTKGKKLPT
jgi:hypothetical protein